MPKEGLSLSDEAPTMIAPPPLSSMSERQVEAMREAAIAVVETAEALAARGANAVSEALKGSEEFEEWSHYPAGDVLDRSTGAQYYYHSHNGAADEHGHFKDSYPNFAGQSKCQGKWSLQSPNRPRPNRQ